VTTELIDAFGETAVAALPSSRERVLLALTIVGFVAPNAMVTCSRSTTASTSASRSSPSPSGRLGKDGVSGCARGGYRSEAIETIVG